MPCDGSYMNANGRDIEESKMFCVRDELIGVPVQESWRRGYHPQAYNAPESQSKVDEVTAWVCSELQKRDVTKLSLEAQIWWRDHQQADKERLERELAMKREAGDRAVALSKLTAYERKLLGLTP